MEAMVTESPYLTYQEAASYCRCDRTTLWRATRSGTLKASGPNEVRVVRFHKDDLDAWMRSRSR
jgi:excisionase family DNA binding protein